MANIHTIHIIITGGFAVKVAHNILEAVGQTPLVRLNKLTKGLERDVLVKLEGLNPGGSIKTRTALSMIEDAENKGMLKPDSIIIEFTSGNQGIGLSLVAAVKGYACTIVMPDCMSLERQMAMRAYGAKLILTPTKESITETFELAKAKVEEMLASDSRYVLAGQFINEANCAAHYNNTANEIIEQLDNTRLDAFVTAIGTGGTITGISHRLKERYPQVHVVAVEPSAAAILSCGIICTHKQQGIGDGFIPDILDCQCYDEVVCVTDQDAYETTRRLASEEGIFAGVSSGTNVWAAIQVAKQLPKGSTVVTILPDIGDRYISVPDLF